MSRKFFKPQGQSLLEMIFAIGILIMTVVAVLAIALSNLTGEKESESQVIANNLAREGIEVVRNIRDTNWLAKAGWDTGLKPPMAGRKGRVSFDAATNQWYLVFPSNQGNPPYRLYLSAEGVLNHVSTGQPTIYYRHLFLDSICLDSDGHEEVKVCSGGEQKIGIKVRSVVGWSERGRARQVMIEDLLYAWK